MKKLSILIFIIFISCIKKSKDKIETSIKIQEVIEVEIPVHKMETSLSFNQVIAKTKTRAIPLTEATNFDGFIEESDYKKVAEQTLKLVDIYPDFYKEGHNYKAIASYRLEFSKGFHSVVVTILKSDHEMETVLINYSLTGNIIDYKVVSYDEIAEGMFKIESIIEQNKLTINSIANIEERSEDITVFKIDAEGKIRTISQKESLINNVIEQLRLVRTKIKNDLVVSKVQPHNPNETIMVIPEIVDEGEHYFELNSHILIVDSATGKILHKYFESYKTNGWESDAIQLREIAIDTAPYKLTETNRAFGVKVRYVGSSQVNPYEKETISLFVMTNYSLKLISSNENNL